MLKWLNAASEFMREDGVRFLCRHGEDLGLPYNWSTVMNSLYKAIGDDGFMIAIDDREQLRGAMAWTLGTGEDDYEDRSRMEVHMLYLEKGVRGRTAIVEAVEALCERELELQQPIAEVGFYCAPTPGYRRLFGRLAAISSTRAHPCGLLDFYLATPGELRAYAFRQRGRGPERQ